MVDSDSTMAQTQPSRSPHLDMQTSVAAAKGPAPIEATSLWSHARSRTMRDLTFPSVASSTALAKCIDTWHATDALGTVEICSGLLEPHGLALRQANLEGISALVIEEPGELKYGYGTYILFRATDAATSGPAILIEAPHRHFDLGTVELGWSVFREATQRASTVGFFFNQAHRYEEPRPASLPEASLSDSHPYDLAHSEIHPFHHASIAFLRDPSSYVLQLHGYEADGAGKSLSRSNNRPPSSSLAIVSNGRERSNNHRRDRLAAAMTVRYGKNVLRYPDETDALGATTNTLGRYLNRNGSERFLHLELSSALRKKLLENTSERDTWSQSIVSVVCSEVLLRCQAVKP